jgi:hypothetical protein
MPPNDKRLDNFWDYLMAAKEMQKTKNKEAKKELEAEAEVEVRLHPKCACWWQTSKKGKRKRADSVVSGDEMPEREVLEQVMNDEMDDEMDDDIGGSTGEMVGQAVDVEVMPSEAVSEPATVAGDVSAFTNVSGPYASRANR